MAKVEIYTKSWCGYSKAALRLLDSKHVDYIHIDVTDNHEQEMVMRARSGAHTVPQVLINDRSIGGFDDLAALDAGGKLDQLLKQEIEPVIPAQQVGAQQDEQLHRS